MAKETRYIDVMVVVEVYQGEKLVAATSQVLSFDEKVWGEGNYKGIHDMLCNNAPMNHTISVYPL